MTSNVPESQCLGFSKYSYVPDSLVSRMAPSPEQLCSTLDYSSYFAGRSFEEEDLVGDAKHLLGIYDERRWGYIGTVHRPSNSRSRQLSTQTGH